MKSCNLLINNGWLQLYCNMYFLASPETWPISKRAKWKENTVRGAGQWPVAGGVLTPDVGLVSVDVGLAVLWASCGRSWRRSACVSCQRGFAPAKDLLLHRWSSNSWKANKSNTFFSILTNFPLLICWSSSASHFTSICLFLLGFAFQGCWHFRMLFAQELLYVKLYFFWSFEVALQYRLIY